MLLDVNEWKIVDAAFHDAGLDHNPGAALRNLFALGCVLHVRGEQVAGKKAVWSALTSIGFQKSNPVIYKKLIEGFNGNETELVNNIRANSEINELLNSL